MLHRPPYRLKANTIVQAIDSLDGQPCGLRWRLVKRKKERLGKVVAHGWECELLPSDSQIKLYGVEPNKALAVEWLPNSYFDSQKGLWIK